MTQCATRTAGVGRFVRALDELAVAMRKHMRDHGPQVVQRAQMRSSYFEGELVDRLKQGGGYVVDEGHLGDKVEGCCAVTVYWPWPVPGEGPDAGRSPYDNDLRFARQGWDEFLRSSMRSVRA